MDPMLNDWGRKGARMATYVTSDAHGHARALDRALELASPGDGDAVVVLGDMIDRGPDPVGVIGIVRGLPGARPLMGNHERMMLDALDGGDADELTWAFNGGAQTLSGLDALPREDLADIVDWMRDLPLFDVAEAGGRTWILAHAGIDALDARGYLATAGAACTAERGAADAPAALLRSMMESQDPADLLWIRERFWDEPTGLVGADGAGPAVVAGHTPSIVLPRYCADADPGLSEGPGRIVMLGAGAGTGGRPDRIDVDCSAAAGPGRGRVGILRLDDGEAFYADIAEGE